MPQDTVSPLVQMVGDPDFAKMDLSEQRKALTAHDPDFARMGDADMIMFVQAHQAAKQQVPSFLDAANQAKQQITSLPMQPSALGGAYPTTQQEQYINQRLPMVPGRVADIRKSALSLAGASLGAGGVAGGGTGLLPAAMRVLGAGAGGAIGNVAGAATSGQMPSPTEALKAGGSMALGQTGGEVLSPFLKWITSSKSLGATMLQQASAKAGQAPVELSAKTNEIVDKIVTQGKLGGRTPKVISDLLDRVGPSTRQAADADPGPLTYNEARILQSNASLSATEQMEAKGAIKSLMPQFAKSFSADVQAAADKAGVGAQHSIGMQQYAAAASKGRMLDRLGDAAKPAIKGAIGGGAGAAAGYEIYRILKGQR